MGRREYQKCSDLKVYSQFAILVKIDKFTILLDLDHTQKILWFSSSFLYYEWSNKDRVSIIHDKRHSQLEAW
jgi:hypothetical protein